MSDPGPIRPADTMYPGRRPAILADRCIYAGEKFCKGDGTATSFRDLLSRKEYSISGLCQACQDDIFGGEDQ